MNDITQIKKHLATIADYKKTFSSDHGQRVLWDLMRQANMVSPIVQRNERGVCVHETFLSEGERNLVLYILAKMKFNERVLMDMIEENKKGERNEYDASRRSGDILATRDDLL